MVEIAIRKRALRSFYALSHSSLHRGRTLLFLLFTPDVFVLSKFIVEGVAVT